MQPNPHHRNYLYNHSDKRSVRIHMRNNVVYISMQSRNVMSYMFFRFGAKNMHRLLFATHNVTFDANKIFYQLLPTIF